MRRSILTLVSLGVLFATPAVAETTSIHIPISESDTASPEAVDALYQRVIEAADNLCEASGPSAAFDRFNCRDAAIDKAVEDADLAPLSARHSGTITVAAADH